MQRRGRRPTLLPYPALFRPMKAFAIAALLAAAVPPAAPNAGDAAPPLAIKDVKDRALQVPESGSVMLLSFASNSNGEKDRKSTRLNSSHVERSYADFCLKKK